MHKTRKENVRVFSEAESIFGVFIRLYVSKNPPRIITTVITESINVRIPPTEKVPAVSINPQNRSTMVISGESDIGLLRWKTLHR
jgi:hypothetical protein